MNTRNTMTCSCRSNTIELTFTNGMPVEVVDRVYCPVCRDHGFPVTSSFPVAGGWFLHFNLEVARMFAMARLNIDPSLVNPGFIIDNHYIEYPR